MAASLAVDAIGLTKRYGNFVAVDSISMQVACGEMYGILATPTTSAS